MGSKYNTIQYNTFSKVSGVDLFSLVSLSSFKTKTYKVKTKAKQKKYNNTELKKSNDLYL